jgi:hypothetical protein
MAIRTNSAGFLYRGSIDDAPPFAQCMWVKYHSFTYTGSPNTSGIAMYRGNTGTGSGNYGVYCTTGGVLTGFTPSGTLAGTTISTGAWHHIAMERASSGTGSANYEFYVNGVSIGTVAGTATDPADATYGCSRDSVNGGQRCDISVRCYRAFNSAFGGAAAVISEANSTTAVKSGSYFDANWNTISDFGGFTEGNAGQATNDTDNPTFSLGSGSGILLRARTDLHGLGGIMAFNPDLS